MNSRQTVKIGWALGWYCALYLFIGEVARSGPHSNADHTARMEHRQIRPSIDTVIFALTSRMCAPTEVIVSVLN